jgi:hypothetical protein
VSRIVAAEYLSLDSVTEDPGPHGSVRAPRLAPDVPATPLAGAVVLVVGAGGVGATVGSMGSWQLPSRCGLVGVGREPPGGPAVWQPLVELIGPLRSAHARMSYPFGRPGDIREDATLGGGALWDIGCYCLDILGWQLGALLEVQAMGELRDGLDWTTVAQVRFASGVLASAWWSFAGPLSQRLSLVGERGTLDLDSPFRASGPAAAWLDTGGGVRRVELPTDDCFRREIEHFGDVIVGSASPAVPLADSARWLRVAEAVDQQVRGTVPGASSLGGRGDGVEGSRAPADLRERVGQPGDR